MVKKIKFSWGIIFLLLFVILINGCETAAGAAKGVAGSVASGIGSTAEGIGNVGKGVGKDSYNFWKFILATDKWIKENLW